MAHMEVQKLATERNSLAEMFIDYTLRVFADRMVKRGYK